MMEYFAKTEKHILDALENCAFPSAVVSVGDGAGVYYKKAFGHSRVLLDDTAPGGVFCGKAPADAPEATTNTLYDMASLSKLIATTTVALRLIEDGELSLYDTVGAFIPDAPRDKRSITIKQLMTHTGGIAAHFALYELCGDNADILRCVLDRELAYEPGTRVCYSCMGYILLAKIMERVTGCGLDALAQSLVFTPLRMRRTCYNPLECERVRGADIATTEYSAREGKYIHGVVHDENARFAGGVSGNAGVFSCVDDLINFATMLSRRGAFEGGYFLTPSVFEAAVRNYTPGMEESRGLGFSLTDGRLHAAGELYSAGSYGHNGFTGTSLYVDSVTGMYVILLTNRVHYTRASDKLFRFRRILHNTATAEYQRMRLEGVTS